MSQDPRSYSTTEVAQRLGISTQTVQRWVDTGQLRAWKTMGGHRRIEAEGVELLFRQRGLGLQDSAEVQDANKAMAGPPALSVLVVDDNPDDRDVLVQLVEDALPSANVAVATNGFHGLIAVGRMAPDVVITDLFMPHMNGVQMIKHLLTGCAVRPRLVLAVSSDSRQEVSRLGELPSGVSFLQKPLDPELFTKTLYAALKQPIASSQS